MRAMKDSGIEWIGEIPQEWKTPPLRSKYSFSKGLSITKADLVDDGVSVISYGQIHSKDNTGVSVRDTLIRHLPTDHSSLTETSKAHVGDFIFADTSEDLQGCGNCVFVDRDDIYAGYHTLLLRPKEIGPGRYYAYLFAAEAWRAQIRAKVSGVKLYSITQDILKSAALIEPPVEERVRIADYLDAKCAEIDALIAAKEKTNELLKERRQSIIYEAVTKGLDPTVPMKDSGVEWIGEIPVGWELKRLKYLGSMQIGLTYSPEEIVADGALVLRSSNIQDGKIVHADDVFVEKEIPEKLKMEKGDILICSRNGSRSLIGKNAVITEEFSGQTFGAFMTIFRGRLNFYIKYLLNSSVFDYYVGSFLTSTINQLTTSNLGNIHVPVPSTEEEMWKIAEYIETECRTIDSIIAMNNERIQKLKEYRQSLIYEAVTGKIEV
ncbi:MAG: restriction endonuclease subunit S [Oscillospiraceae bacterium]|nr:restriction endonuclease subunit S [Oscillospiraceae bacterium]